MIWERVTLKYGLAEATSSPPLTEVSFTVLETKSTVDCTGASPEETANGRNKKREVCVPRRPGQTT